MNPRRCCFCDDPLEHHTHYLENPDGTNRALCGTCIIYGYLKILEARHNEREAAEDFEQESRWLDDGGAPSSTQSGSYAPESGSGPERKGAVTNRQEVAV